GPGTLRPQVVFLYVCTALPPCACRRVVAGARRPASMNGLEGRLCSRFQWGLVADIQPPDTETRLAIIKAKATEQHHVDLPEDVARLLADRAPDNIRELEGQLNRVVAYAKLIRAATITME